MSESDKNILTPEWVQKKLAALRQALEESGTWLAKTTNHLVHHLTLNAQESIDEGDYEMLSLVVNDALEGVDISRRYPAYYQKMLTNPQLFEAFLEMVEVLEEDRAGQLESPPEKATYDLSFLDKSTPLPIVTQKETGQWTIIWQQAAEKFQSLFLHPGFPPLAYRGIDLLEENYFTLLRGEAALGEKTVDMMLEAAWDGDEERRALRLILTVAFFSEGTTPGERLPDIQVDLKWGNYNETTIIDQYGQGTFPLLPFQAIADPTNQLINANLQIRLELTSSH